MALQGTPTDLQLAALQALLAGSRRLLVADGLQQHSRYYRSLFLGHINASAYSCCCRLPGHR
jgi:hypothetical protein